MNSPKTYRAIGLMSGTSVDGLDIAYCELYRDELNLWSFKIKIAETVPYSQEWKRSLHEAYQLNGRDLFFLNVNLGQYFGEQVVRFIQDHNVEVDFVASHGHTIFHEPENGMTVQIGSGAEIAAQTGVKCICDFRSVDLALFGQGAPLVPIGDRLLFSEYDYCVNLGGIANISAMKGEQPIAFDICPANAVLNQVSKMLGMEYDGGGKIAASGNLDQKLFDQLNALEYYHKAGPKSIGREWIVENIFPLIADSGLSETDLLHTFCHHIAFQVAKVVDHGKVLFTGGGTHNEFLIECLKKYFKTDSEIVIPNANIIDFKEALIFALLGALRLEEEVNVLSSVTGGSRDNIGGCVYLS